LESLIIYYSPDYRIFRIELGIGKRQGSREQGAGGKDILTHDLKI